MKIYDINILYLYRIYKQEMAKESRESRECEICCFSKKSVFSCPYCNYNACTQCCERVILDSINDPSCVSCKKAYSSDFFHQTFTNAFITKKYKAHREQILYEKEKSLLPATQVEVERRLKKQVIEEKMRDIRAQIAELKKKMLRYEEELWALDSKTEEKSERREFVCQCPSNDCRGFLSTRYKCSICGIQACSDCREIKRENEDHKCDPNTLETIKELQKTTRSCPNCQTRIFKIEGCFAKNQPILMYDGSTKMSQDIDIGDELVGDDGNKRIVLHLTRGEDEMYEVRQNNGETYTVNSQHKLVLQNSDTDEIMEITVENYIKLPVKNNLFGIKSLSLNGVYNRTSINVISIGKNNFYGWSVDQNKRFLLPDHTVVRNCDQMWCTQCNVAFCWRTGKIEKGIIHNPHYFEYMRRNGQDAPRNPHEVRCGGLPRVDVLKYFTVKKKQEKAMEIYRMVNHLRDVNLRVLPTHVDNQSNLELRVDFMMKTIDENAFKTKLQRKEKDRLKKLEQRDIIEMYCNVVQDLFVAFETDMKNPSKSREKSIDEFFEAEQQIRKYSGESYSKLNKKYKSDVKCPIELLNDY